MKILIQLHLVRLGQKKKKSCFRKPTEWKNFYQSPACIVEYVSEYIFLISKNEQSKKNQNKARIQKKQKKLKKKENISGKSIKKINLRPAG